MTINATILQEKLRSIGKTIVTYFKTFMVTQFMALDTGDPMD